MAQNCPNQDTDLSEACGDSSWYESAIYGLLDDIVDAANIHLAAEGAAQLSYITRPDTDGAMDYAEFQRIESFLASVIASGRVPKYAFDANNPGNKFPDPTNAAEVQDWVDCDAYWLSLQAVRDCLTQSVDTVPTEATCADLPTINSFQKMLKCLASGKCYPSCQCPECTGGGPGEDCWQLNECSPGTEVLIVTNDMSQLAAGTVVETGGKCYELSTLPVECDGAVELVGFVIHPTCAECLTEDCWYLYECPAVNQVWKRCDNDAVCAVISFAHNELDLYYAFLCIDNTRVAAYRDKTLTATAATDPQMIPQCCDCEGMTCDNLKGVPADDAFDTCPDGPEEGCDSYSLDPEKDPGRGGIRWSKVSSPSAQYSDVVHGPGCTGSAYTAAVNKYDDFNGVWTPSPPPADTQLTVLNHSVAGNNFDTRMAMQIEKLPTYGPDPGDWHGFFLFAGGTAEAGRYEVGIRWHNNDGYQLYCLVPDPYPIGSPALTPRLEFTSPLAALPQGVQFRIVSGGGSLTFSARTAGIAAGTWTPASWVTVLTWPPPPPPGQSADAAPELAAIGFGLSHKGHDSQLANQSWISFKSAGEPLDNRKAFNLRVDGDPVFIDMSDPAIPVCSPSAAVPTVNDTPAELVVTNALDPEFALNQVIKHNDKCWSISGQWDCDGTEVFVPEPLDVYDDCDDCLFDCYLLTECYNPSNTLLVSNDLSGLSDTDVIEYDHDDDGNATCWEISGPADCTGSEVNMASYIVHDDCPTCVGNYEAEECRTVYRYDTPVHEQTVRTVYEYVDPAHSQTVKNCYEYVDPAHSQSIKRSYEYVQATYDASGNPNGDTLSYRYEPAQTEMPQAPKSYRYEPVQLDMPQAPKSYRYEPVQLDMPQAP